MGLLIRLGYDVDHLDPAVVIDLARSAVFARPLVGRPGRAFLIRVRILVVFALEPKGLVLPGQFQNLKDFLKRLAIADIDVALIAGRRPDVNLLRHRTEPAGLIAAGKADVGAPFGELVEPGNFQGEPQRVPARQDVTDGADLEG